MRRSLLALGVICMLLWPQVGWGQPHPLLTSHELTAEQQVLIDQLLALGYAGLTEEVQVDPGVSRYAPERASPGLNLYLSGETPSAHLIDMHGEVLHQWQVHLDAVWPDTPGRRSYERQWRRARLLPGGELLAIFEGMGLIKLDRDSELVWANRNGAHHDLQVMPDGRIFVLTREPRVMPDIHPERPVLEEFVEVLGPDGKTQQKLALFDVFRRSESLWQHVQGKSGDIFHVNELHVFDGALAERSPLFAKGNVLLSMRHIHTLAIVDLHAGEVLWTHTFPFSRQHASHLLDSGHVLVFDNQPQHPASWSRILELDPLNDGEVVWSYRGTEEDPFFSKVQGAVQRLPNGNTLIVESARGRAFEVTHEGEIVWQFANPHEREGKRATIPDLIRLPLDVPRP